MSEAEYRPSFEEALKPTSARASCRASNSYALCESYAQLCERSDDKLFRCVTSVDTHLMHRFLPPKVTRPHGPDLILRNFMDSTIFFSSIFSSISSSVSSNIYPLQYSPQYFLLSPSSIRPLIRDTDANTIRVVSEFRVWYQISIPAHHS